MDRTILLAYKHKTHAVDNYGKIISSADFDFYIDEVARLMCTNYDLFVFGFLWATCIPFCLCIHKECLLFHIFINLLGEKDDVYFASF